MNICDKCGFINESDDVSICNNCNSDIDNENINKIIPFAQNAVLYGFFYRTDYERQVKEKGEVSIKYSLLTPSNYWELLAVFALSGYIGGVSFQLVNYIGKQILDLIKNKPVKDRDAESIERLINNPDDLKKFTKYIIDYYKGEYGEEKVAHAVIEEEIADIASHEKQVESLEFMENFSDEKKDEFLKLFKELAHGVAERRRRLKPDKGLLKDVFKTTKKMLKKNHKKK